MPFRGQLGVKNKSTAQQASQFKRAKLGFQAVQVAEQQLLKVKYLIGKAQKQLHFK